MHDRFARAMRSSVKIDVRDLKRAMADFVTGHLARG